MAFVSLVSEEQATERLKALYAQIRGEMGFLPNYFQALGPFPDLIEAHLKLSAALFALLGLGQDVKERLGIVVSGINSSSYCIALHMELLRKMGVEKPLSRKLATHYADAAVGEKEQALYRFADKLTRHPDDMSRGDVEALRQAGWEEKTVVELVLTVSLFNFINRVSSGLGLVADF